MALTCASSFINDSPLCSWQITQICCSVFCCLYCFEWKQLHQISYFHSVKEAASLVLRLKSLYGNVYQFLMSHNFCEASPHVSFSMLWSTYIFGWGKQEMQESHRKGVCLSILFTRLGAVTWAGTAEHEAGERRAVLARPEMEGDTSRMPAFSNCRLFVYRETWTNSGWDYRIGAKLNNVVLLFALRYDCEELQTRHTATAFTLGSAVRLRQKECVPFWQHFNTNL